MHVDVHVCDEAFSLSTPGCCCCPARTIGITARQSRESKLQLMNRREASCPILNPPLDYASLLVVVYCRVALHTMQRDSTRNHVTASTRNRTFVIACASCHRFRYKRKTSSNDLPSLCIFLQSWNVLSNFG